MATLSRLLIMIGLLIMGIAAPAALAQSNSSNPDFPAARPAEQNVPTYVSGCVWDNDNWRGYQHTDNCNENDDNDRLTYVPRVIDIANVPAVTAPAAVAQAQPEPTVVVQAQAEAQAAPQIHVKAITGEVAVPTTVKCMTWQTGDGSCFQANELQTAVSAKTNNATSIRNGPSDISGELGTRQAGEDLTVHLVKGGWAYVSDSGGYSWVPMQDLTLTSLRL